jgi:serine/threonine protein kinase
MIDIREYIDNGKAFDGKYRLIRPLSTSGGTADVWLALDLNTVKSTDDIGDLRGMSDEEIEQIGLVVAIKVYRPQNALDIEGEQRFREEYMIVFNCHHTNLIHPTHFSIFREIPYLVLPYCKLGSAERRIGKLEDDEAKWKFASDVAGGLAYLHALEPPIIHQDIKPGNVLIDDSQNYSITDFGISAKSGGVSDRDTFEEEERSGTMAYMSPERYREDAEPSTAGDVWAYGAMLYEMITGAVPFGEQGGWAQVEDPTAMPKIPTDIPVDMQRLIAACLDPDPEKRPTAEYLSQATAAHQYPLKPKKTGLIIGISVLVALLIGVAATWLLRSPEVEVQIVTEEAELRPAEEIFDEAMALVNLNDADSLQAGLELMRELNARNYVPAIYELAFTYGWYSDSASLNRKRLLGIEVDNMYLPKERDYSNMAIAYFTKIKELNDSNYADINANACYRFACYYVMPNKVFVQNFKDGKDFLLKAREWAVIADDKPLLERIDAGLATF